MRRTLLLAAAFAGFATSAFAERATTYQPTSASRGRSGYEETQIDGNRIRVRFAGNPGTELETVEVNLLYRVAETTLARGYDYFVIVGHNVETTSEFESAGAFGRRGMVSYREVPRHQAVADVAMFYGVRPPLAANAYDARAVQANLAPRIKHPRQS
jgi:hypothetical protein